MTESKSNKSNQIDLGLSSILAGLEAERGKRGSGDQPSHPAEEAQTQEPSMEQLLSARRWRDIITRAERDMATVGSAEASLWWIRGHLGALTMPVSLLIAPFEQVVAKLGAQISAATHKQHLQEIGAIMFERLQQVGERDQVLAFKSLLEKNGILEVSDPIGKHRSSWSLSPASSVVNPSESSSEAVALVAERPVKGLSSRAIPVAAACVLLLALAVFGWKFLLVTGPTSAISESFVRDAAVPEQVFPELAPRDPVGNLSALYYSIDGSEGVKGDGKEVAAAASSDASADVETPAAKQPPLTTPVVSAKLPKERINTSGPIESPEYRKGARRRREEQDKEAVHDRSQRGPLSDRPPTTPFDRDPVTHVYRVLVETKVTSSPSYVASVVGRLRTGDQVLVDGRVGNWYRLRSRNGNPGYVLVQNVESTEPRTDKP